MRIFVTGVGGLVGSAVAEVARAKNHIVWGIDSDQRGKWFGKDGSVAWKLRELSQKGIIVAEENFRSRLDLVKGADLIVHCASQPSHDFSRTHVLEDSLTNYTGTAELLEETRKYNPKAVFVFLSTNKVYGDAINREKFVQEGDRLVPCLDGWKTGVDETFSIDSSLHTPFGVSKLGADLMVQEYRRCFGLKTVTFRCGCLTGKSGTAIEMQGFLGYLVKCAVAGKTYTIYGHGGYQVRDNIAAEDVAEAILAYAEAPKGHVYNMGGGWKNAVSILEVVEYLREKHGCQFEIRHGSPRLGDHAWWITDTTKFENDYPTWTRKNVWAVIDEMVEHEVSRGQSGRRRTA